MANPTGSGNARQTTEARYTCPMHPSVMRDAPGTCPECKMKLERRS